MDYSVTHPGHFLPWNLCKSATYLVRYVFRGFSDDLDGSFGSGPGFQVGYEFLLLDTFNKRLGILHPIYDVL